jgi:4-hydroxy-2-oxoglutarate aldolase
MTKRPRGLLVPITTPFDRVSGDLAPVDLRENARSILAVGADGLVAAGSTGEASLLTEDEYRRVLESLRDVVPPERWLVAGAGRESTRATVQACRAAADAGADAVLVRAPAYYAPVITPASLLEHFRQVADESPVPVLLYHFPKYTHVPLTDGLARDLAPHENVWGIKDSSGDLKNFAAYQSAAPNWSHFIGFGALYYAALEMGAAGAIAAVGNFAAEATVAIGRAFAEGDTKAAGAAQERVAPLHTGIVGAMGVPGVKAAMDAVGLVGGPSRLPVPNLEGAKRDEVVALLGTAGLVDS